MVVYNKSEISKEEVLSSLIKTTKKEQTSKVIMSTVILVFGMILLIYGNMARQSNFIGIGYVFLVCGVVYYALVFYAVLKAPKRVYTKNKEICDNGVTYEYTFKEQSFQVLVSVQSKTTRLPYTYDSLKKVYEYKDRYELKLTDNQFLFVKKSGFASLKIQEFFVKNITKNKKKIVQKYKVK